MKIEIFIDPVTKIGQKLTTARIVAKLGIINRFYSSRLAILIPIFVFLIFGSIVYNIFANQDGISSVRFDQWFMLIWFGVVLKGQFGLIRNFVASKGKTFEALPKSVEGLNHGPAIVELTENVLGIDVPLEKETIGWEAITNVVEHKGEFHLSSHHNHLVSIPVSEEARQFFKAKKYFG